MHGNHTTEMEDDTLYRMDGDMDISTKAYYVSMYILVLMPFIAVFGIMLYVAYRFILFKRTDLDNEESIEMKRYEITPCIL
jgi:hypothetical protein